MARPAAARDRTAPLRGIYALEPFFALLLAIAAAPFGILLALAIVVLSRRSPLVRHRRVGWRGEELGVLKFRTMWRRGDPGRIRAIEDLPETACFVKAAADDRVTSRFAQWCRRMSLDEMPQLVHVIRGEMSLVGPRPITRAELDAYYGNAAAEVLSLRPGITGLWQVMGRNRLTYAQRRRLDLWLVRRASPRLFFAILARTVPRVLSGRGAY
jgi:exopolysaccharide production protein ExoY